MSERKHHGGKPKKKCFTFLKGELKLHEDIPTAAAYLGVAGAGGSYIRRMLLDQGVYRPRVGGVCWPFEDEAPEEAIEAMKDWPEVMTK